MEHTPLHLSWTPDGSAACDCLLIIPRQALEEHGYIKALHRSATANKHAFQALAQTGYYQHQDDELDWCETGGAIAVVNGSDREILADGMVLFRDTGGLIKAVVHTSAPVHKLLEAAHRYCTRWVRLDI